MCIYWNAARNTCRSFLALARCVSQKKSKSLMSVLCFDSMQWPLAS